ncbi:MAG: hypothetical protein RLZZ546_296 [Bacteroidota bacterium]
MGKVLILGNLGYVGSELSKFMAKKNDVVCGIDSGYFANNTIGTLTLPEVYMHEQKYKDVRDIQADDINGYDSIVILSAISNDPIGNKFEDVTYDINLNGTKKIIRLAVEANIPNIVFASSCSVYGKTGTAAVKEDDESNPLTAYAKSKVQIEEYAKSIDLRDTNFTALRFATACGPSDRLRIDLVLNDFVFSSIINNRIDILSDGSPLRPLIDVRDMCIAIDWACNRPQGTAQQHLILNTGRNDWNFSVLDIANAVKEVLPNVTININPNGKGDPRSYMVNFDKFNECTQNLFGKRSITSTVNDLLEKLSKINDLVNKNNLIRLNSLEMLLKEKILDNNLRYVK